MKSFIILWDKHQALLQCCCFYLLKFLLQVLDHFILHLLWTDIHWHCILQLPIKSIFILYVHNTEIWFYIGNVNIGIWSTVKKQHGVARALQNNCGGKKTKQLIGHKYQEKKWFYFPVNQYYLPMCMQKDLVIHLILLLWNTTLVWERVCISDKRIIHFFHHYFNSVVCTS